MYFVLWMFAGCCILLGIAAMLYLWERGQKRIKNIKKKASPLYNYAAKGEIEKLQKVIDELNVCLTKFFADQTDKSISERFDAMQNQLIEIVDKRLVSS